MPMTTAEFKRLKDLLMRAAATDSDPELVQCFRRASVLLAAHGHTWAQAMNRVVRVVDPVANIEIHADPIDALERGTRPTAVKSRPFLKSGDGEDWDRLFDDAMAGASGSFLETLEDIHSKWEKNGTLSPRQAEVVRDAAERYAARHPGGRVR